MGDFALRFAPLIHRANFNAFAKTPSQITIMPSRSQPGLPPYGARGIWTVTPIDVQLMDGSLASSEERTLWIVLSEFPIPPIQGDTIEIDGVWHTIGDEDNNGQGACKLTLKEVP